jgi:hypothetical protein
MATAVASIEPVFISGPLLEKLPEAPVRIHRPQSRWDASWNKQAAVEAEPGGEEQPPRQHAKRLGDSILYSAVVDYMGADERNHLSADLLLYPADEHYEAHLRWVCSLTNFPMHYLRATLDRLRPQWDALRQLKKERR